MYLEHYILQLLSGPLLWLWTGFGAPSAYHPTVMPEFERGPTGKHLIALTFDAGGDDLSFPQLLYGLDLADIRCTFFVTGQWARQHRDYVKQLACNGHEVGNHTWHHKDLTQLKDAEIKWEILQTDKLLAEQLRKQPVRLFRAPYGSRNNRVLRIISDLGFQSVYWSLDSLDSVGDKKTQQYLFNRIVMRRPGELDGAVILMHVGEPATAEVVPYLIHALKAQGYRFVTVSQLMASTEMRAAVAH